MTEPLDSVVVTIITQRCKDLVTNLMTEEELRALVNTEILSYNSETPAPTDPSEFGPVETDNIPEAEDAVINLLRGYVRGTLPLQLENTVRWTDDPDAEIEDISTIPAGDQYTPAPNPVYNPPAPSY